MCRILSFMLLFLSCVSLAPARAAQLVKDYIFLIDVSGSMIGKGDGNGSIVFPELKKATGDFISKNIPDGSRLRIFTFGEKVFGNQEFTVDAAGRQAAISYIKGLQAIGQKTDLYGTTNEALKIAGDAHDKPIMLLIFTDGKDNVQRASAAEVLSKYKIYTSKNPNLYVLCQYFAFHNSDTPSPFPEGIPALRLNRDDEHFLKNLQTSLSQFDKQIGKNLAEIKQEQEKLKSKQQEIEAEKAGIAAKLHELNQTKQALTKQQQAMKDHYETSLKKLQDREEALREQEKKRLAAIQQKRQELDSEMRKLAAEGQKVRGTQAILRKADKLLAEARSITDYMQARASYESVLDTDPHNTRAAYGLKECDRHIDQLTPAYRKKINWFYAVIVAGLLFLLNRLIYMGVLPNPLAAFKTKPVLCRLSYEYEGKKRELTATIKQKVGAVSIGKTRGQIILPLPCISDNHLVIRRRKAKCFLSPQNGKVLDANRQPITGERPVRSYAETFYLRPNNKGKESGNDSCEVKATITIG